MATDRPVAAYTLFIETFGPGIDGLDLDRDEGLFDALGSTPATGVVISGGGLAGGFGATFTVEVSRDDAHPIARAVSSGVRWFERACARAGIRHDGIARVDIVSERYLELEDQREPERFLGVSEVAALLGVSRQRVGELRKKQGFPAPVAELAAGPVWSSSSLGRFLQAWDRRPGRPRRPERDIGSMLPPRGLRSTALSDALHEERRERLPSTWTSKPMGARVDLEDDETVRRAVDDA